MTVAVVAVGNEYRRDDGVGPAVLEQLRAHDLADVSLVHTDGEPTQLLDAWEGLDLAIVVDAVLCEPHTPGRIHRTALGGVPLPSATSSTHGLGVPEAIQLAEALDRAPARLVVLAVEAADLGFGAGLSPEVADAVPQVVAAVLAELNSADRYPAGG